MEQLDRVDAPTEGEYTQTFRTVPSELNVGLLAFRTSSADRRSRPTPAPGYARYVIFCCGLDISGNTQIGSSDAPPPPMNVYALVTSCGHSTTPFFTYLRKVRAIHGSHDGERMIWVDFKLPGEHAHIRCYGSSIQLSDTKQAGEKFAWIFARPINATQGLENQFLKGCMSDAFALALQPRQCNRNGRLWFIDVASNWHDSLGLIEFMQRGVSMRT